MQADCLEPQQHTGWRIDAGPTPTPPHTIQFRTNQAIWNVLDAGTSSPHSFNDFEFASLFLCELSLSLSLSPALSSSPCVMGAGKEMTKKRSIVAGSWGENTHKQIYILLLRKGLIGERRAASVWRAGGEQIWKLDKIETKGDGVQELPGAARNWNGKWVRMLLLDSVPPCWKGRMGG